MIFANWRRVIVITYLAYLVFDLLLSYLGHVGDNSPETRQQLLQHFSEKQIADGIEYSQRGFTVRILQTIFMAAVLLWLAFSGISQRVEKYFEGLTGQRHFLTAMLVIAALITFLQVIGLPFSYYFGYHLEHKFGFSNLDHAGWLLLKLKGYLLSIFLGAPVGAFVLWLINKFKKSWLFTATGFFLFFQLLTSYLQPYVFIPLFFKVSPLEAGELRTQISLLVKKGNVSLENIFLVDASRYSKHTNAFFTGWGNQKRIYLFDTLKKKNTTAEIVSILGHEMGHWKLYHVPMGIAISTIGFFLTLFFLKWLFRRLKNDSTIPLNEFASASSLPMFALVLAVTSIVTTPAMTNLSRFNEGQSDQFALEITSDVEAYISTEKKLAIHNKSRLNPHPFYVFFNYSHPPAIERIRRGVEFKGQ